MFPKKLNFAAEPEEMREIFSFLIAKSRTNVIFVSHFDKGYICCQRLVKESKLKFNQFGAFGAFNSSHVRVIPDKIASFWENLGPFLLTRNFMVIFCFHQFLISQYAGLFRF